MVKKKDFFHKVEEEIFEDAEEILEEKLKPKIIKFSEISILILTGIILFSIGFAKLLANFYPILGNGINYFITAIIIFIIASLFR